MNEQALGVEVGRGNQAILDQGECDKMFVSFGRKVGCAFLYHTLMIC